jgi:hypothetical protein
MTDMALTATAVLTALLGCATTADAQVTPRFGVHDDYDRVVVALPAGGGFSSSQSGSTLTVRLPGAGHVAPPGQAGHRVLGMLGGEGELSIRMAPGTHAHVFRIGTKLAIDVAAGAPPAGAPPSGLSAASGQMAPLRAASSQSVPAPHRIVTLSPKRLPAHAATDLETLRQELTQKLAALDAPAPADTLPPQTAASDGVAKVADVAAMPARAICRPAFDMASWQGGGFTERRTQLRARIASSHAAPASLAAFAEFYLAHGLAGEALEAASEGLAGDDASAGASRPSPDDDATRLRRDADLARLMKGEQIATASPLLAAPADCASPDLALWQALAAATVPDPAGIERTMAKAQAALRTLPEPVRSILAYRLADAVEDGSSALPLIAEALRNTAQDTQEDRAAGWLLDGRLAAAKGHSEDAAKFLTKAAGTGRSLPALQAKVRLVELAARADAPLSRHDEATLADIARVYRDDALGQGAAAELAERKLRENNFPAALDIADQSARAGGRQRVSERGGAALIGRILRTLLISPRQAHLPQPAQRAALFLPYQGYATPGADGDDIRLAAARLLLAQGLPQAALDAAHQLAAPTIASPAGLATLATAEALGGDPAKALALLHDAPPDADLHRAAALALARLDRPAEAAGQLDGLTDLADRLRRASLLATAKDWAAAAAAYADLLHDHDLKPEARAEASDRYGLAIVLSGGRPDPGLRLPDNGLAARALAVLPAQTAAAPPATPDMSARSAVDAVRDALQRARAIDTLLPPAAANQGA